MSWNAFEEDQNREQYNLLLERLHGKGAVSKAKRKGWGGVVSADELMSKALPGVISQAVAETLEPYVDADGNIIIELEKR